MIFDNDNKDFYERQSEGADQRRRNRLTNPTQFSGLGKLPPQAIDLEEAVLGALLLVKDTYLIVGEFLKTDMLYKDSHQKIYNAISLLHAENSPIDLLTVTAKLRNLGELEMIGGAYYLTELTERVTSAANIEYHSRIIYQKYLQREMIRISTDTIQSAYEDTSDVFEIHDANQTELFNLFSYTNARNIDSIETLLNESITELSKENVNELTGVGTGFNELDILTNGWQKSDAVILAARPAMGKSAMMLKLARNATVTFKKPTVIFSLEMSKRQLTYRLISDETGILLEDINKKRLSDYDKLRLNTAVAELKKSPLHIDDTPSLALEIFRSKCIRLKKKKDIQLIIVDYLQLMTISGNRKGMSREQEISKISAGLKSIAKELDVPVIALSQLSRAVEGRAGMSKRPMLSDLRESGSIEQDADQVFFLYRPEYYGVTQDGDGNSVIGLCELICAKNRHGATDIIKLRFEGKYMRFSDWVVADNALDIPLFRPSNMYQQD